MRCSSSRATAMASTTSVPGRTARWRSARLAMPVRRGSTTTERGAVAAGVLHERREVRVRDRRVGPPDHHQLGVHDVERIGAGHAAEHHRPRHAGGGRADGVVDLAGPERVPEERAEHAARRSRRPTSCRGRGRRWPGRRRGPRRCGPATRSSASSHDAGRNSPAPFGPVRISGVITRSGLYTRRWWPFTFLQMKPWVNGLIVGSSTSAGAASTFTRRPSSTTTSSVQPSGQSSGQAVRSVVTGLVSGSGLPGHVRAAGSIRAG